MLTHKQCECVRGKLFYSRDIKKQTILQGLLVKYSVTMRRWLGIVIQTQRVA